MILVMILKPDKNPHTLEEPQESTTGAPEMWTATSWLLNHHKAPAHTALSIRELLAKNSIPTLPQPPPNSPALSHSNYFLFPKLKIILKGRRFQTVEDIITKVTNDLKAILQTSFDQCFQKYKRRWKSCIAVQGGLFLKGITFNTKRKILLTDKLRELSEHLVSYSLGF
jgi:hypothetical protein